MEALATVEQPVVLQLLERLAQSPDVPVDKLQALLDMQRALASDRAAVAFHAAMSSAQEEMRPVAADAENPQTRSRYASYRALDSALRPVYTKHGFSLSFDTDVSPLPDHIRVLCYVAHRAGFSRTYKIDMPNDGKGAKGGDVMTKTHATGAGASYGMRYLLKMIFNVAVGEDDQDGNDRSEAPAGYGGFIDDLEAVAENGFAALQTAFAEAQKKRKECLRYLTEHERKRWEAIKAKANKVKAS